MNNLSLFDVGEASVAQDVCKSVRVVFGRVLELPSIVETIEKLFENTLFDTRLHFLMINSLSQLRVVFAC